MAFWTKITYKAKRPLKWWWHKVMCEICYFMRGSRKGYYFHLHKLQAIGWNLYGVPNNFNYGFDLTADYDALINQQDDLKRESIYYSCGMPTTEMLKKTLGIFEEYNRRKQPKQKAWWEDVHTMD